MKLDLDGLVVIGGDDSNTNACLLAENLRYVVMNFFGVVLLVRGNLHSSLLVADFSIIFLKLNLMTWEFSSMRRVAYLFF